MLIAEVDPTRVVENPSAPTMSNTGRVADADEPAAVIVFLASDSQQHQRRHPAG